MTNMAKRMLLQSAIHPAALGICMMTVDHVGTADDVGVSYDLVVEYVEPMPQLILFSVSRVLSLALAEKSSLPGNASDGTQKRRSVSVPVRGVRKSHRAWGTTTPMQHCLHWMVPLRRYGCTGTTGLLSRLGRFVSTLQIPSVRKGWVLGPDSRPNVFPFSVLGTVIESRPVKKLESTSRQTKAVFSSGAHGSADEVWLGELLPSGKRL